MRQNQPIPRNPSAAATAMPSVKSSFRRRIPHGNDYIEDFRRAGQRSCWDWIAQYLAGLGRPSRAGRRPKTGANCLTRCPPSAPGAGVNRFAAIMRELRQPCNARRSRSGNHPRFFAYFACTGVNSGRFLARCWPPHSTPMACHWEDLAGGG